MISLKANRKDKVNDSCYVKTELINLYNLYELIY